MQRKQLSMLRLEEDIKELLLRKKHQHQGHLFSLDLEVLDEEVIESMHGGHTSNQVHRPKVFYQCEETGSSCERPTRQLSRLE